MSVEILYGVPGRWTDVTCLALQTCKRSQTGLEIPAGEVQRVAVFWDVLPGVLKQILIRRQGHPDQILLWNQTYQVDLLDDMKLPARDPVLARVYEATQQLQSIHDSLRFEGGSLLSEHDEQLMSVLFIPSDAKVLEIGANIGRNTCTISKLLTDSSNLVAVESCKETVDQLVTNRQLNNLSFQIEAAAISSTPLKQSRWKTEAMKPEEVLTQGFEVVRTITWPMFAQKYPLQFDTLVADCEGALFPILTDYPQLLEGIIRIIIENDFSTLPERQYVHNLFTTNGFRCVYRKPYGENIDFYQTWLKD